MADIVDIAARLKARSKPEAWKIDPETLPPAKPAQTGADERRKDVAYDANTIYLHGPNGLLNAPGIEPDVMAVIQRPRGLSQYLPLIASNDMVPLFDVITGQSEGEGAEPADVCSEPPGPGDLKEEALTAPFGLVNRRTDKVTATAFGRRTNRAEPMDLYLVNQMVANSPWIPDPARDTNFIQSERGYKLFMLGMEFEREMERQVFSGNYAGATNGYAQFYGLETLVNTGKVGALSGQAVPALDSTIINWGSGLFDGTVTINGKALNIVELLSSLIHFMEARAADTGLAPVQYALVMPRDLFWELTAVWPCQYLSTGCGVNDSAGERFIVATGREQVLDRDMYRNRSFLMINGRAYPVIQSEGMSQAQAQLGVSTDIYLLPMSVGGRRSLYFNYFDFNNASLTEALQDLPEGEIFTSNNGLFVLTYERSAFCWYVQAIVRARLVLRTPWLAARIQNVVYKTAYHTFDGFLDGLYPPPNGGMYKKPWGTEYTTKVYPTSV